MTMVIPDFSQTSVSVPLERPKRMLEIKKQVNPENGRPQTIVNINFSSLDVIQTCKRKAEYSLIRGLRSNAESEALIFGTAIHKALEAWYLLPREKRELSAKDWEIAQTFISGAQDTNDFEGALGALKAFALKAAPLRALGEENKRSVMNGLKILRAYFKHYLDDGLEVVHDERGPIIERDVEFMLAKRPDDSLIVNYFGTIDAILRDTVSGQVFVADHKTTHALGADFYNRINPNFQYTGYVLAARQCLGIHTDTFMVNGIQVVKTKQEFSRQFTRRTEEDFIELSHAVTRAVDELITCEETGFYPMNTPSPCAMYGGCQYLPICSLPANMRDNTIKTQYHSRDGV